MADKENSLKKMEVYFEKGNGYLTTSEIVKAGFSRETLRRFVSLKRLTKLSDGIYISGDCFEDSLFTISLKNKIIFSLETSLYLHGLMEKEPKYITASVKYGYNATNLKKKGLKIYSLSDKFYSLGKTTAKTIFGNTVPVYDIDRTVCDIIRYKDELDVEVFATALKEYAKSDKKNLVNLTNYAKALHVDDRVKIYMEVLL